MPLPPIRFRPAVNVLNVGVFLLSVLAIVIVLNFFGLRDTYRGRIDATKTRAYSLSPQTVQTIEQLERGPHSRSNANGVPGTWTIGLLVNPRQVDRAARKQVEEVLSRFDDASEHIDAVFVDPTDPAAFNEYERILTTLRTAHREQIEEYDQALDDGAALFVRFQQFAQQQAPLLRQVLERISPSLPQFAPLQAALTNLGLLAGAQQIPATIEQARTIDESRPIPDYEAARSTLIAALTNAANTLNDIAITLDELRSSGEFTRPLESRAMDLAAAADRLRRLPEMELSRIGEQMQSGNCAVIAGPNGSTVIPDHTLFPQSVRASALSGRVTMDTRFRGEQVFGAAMRTLLVGRMPRVVFVHAENRSLFNESPNHADLYGVRRILESSGFAAEEWQLTTTPARPTFDEQGPIVWVVIPPLNPSLDPTDAERNLLRETRALIADGQPVLLNIEPSALHQYGQPGRWDDIAAPFGVHADTAHIVFERTLSQEDDSVVQMGQTLRDLDHDHVIGRAVSGQQLFLWLPIRLMPTRETPAGVRRSTLAKIEPHQDRWLDDDDWNASRNQIDDPDVDETFDTPLPVIATIERPHPVDSGTQRAIVVGSGRWMLSMFADQVIGTGDQRIAQVNPGNYELMQAGVLWLAGMDDLIAASPLSQEVARLRDLPPDRRRVWFWIIVVALPIGSLITGGAVWVYRRT